MNNILIDLGNRIRLLRKSKGWSQEKFAMESGLDRTYISSLEKGKRNIAISNLCKIAQAFGLSLSELLELTEK